MVTGCPPSQTLDLNLFYGLKTHNKTDRPCYLLSFSVYHCVTVSIFKYPVYTGDFRYLGWAGIIARSALSLDLHYRSTCIIARPVIALYLHYRSTDNFIRLALSFNLHYPSIGIIARPTISLDLQYRSTGIIARPA